MRARTIAAGVTAIFMAHVAQADVIVGAPAGLIGGMDAGPLLTADQPGARLGLALASELHASFSGTTVQAPTANLLPKPRRFASMLDLFSERDLGLRLSAGFKFLSRKGVAAWSPTRETKAGSLIYSPAAFGAMPDRRTMARAAPTVAIGWTRAVSSMAAIGFDVGAVAEHGLQRATMAAIAQPRLAINAFSQVAPVAHLAFAMRF